MNALNSVLIEGNVIANPENKESPRGVTVCDFKIASSRLYRQDETIKEEKSVFAIEAWGELAGWCAENCTKGRGVRVIGRLKQCEDGTIKVVAAHVELIPQKSLNERGENE